MKTFKELKVLDSIWIVKESKRPISNELEAYFEHLLIDKDKNKYDSYDLIETTITEIIYPAKVETSPMYYMKMSGDRPCGVGSSTGIKEDPDYIQFKIVEKKDTTKSHLIKTIVDGKAYLDYGKSYFIHEQEAKDDIKNKLQKRLNELEKSKKKIVDEESFITEKMNSL